MRTSNPRRRHSNNNSSSPIRHLSTTFPSIRSTKHRCKCNSSSDTSTTRRRSTCRPPSVSGLMALVTTKITARRHRSPNSSHRLARCSQGHFQDHRGAADLAATTFLSEAATEEDPARAEDAELVSQTEVEEEEVVP
jgi:hypothetical protein